MKYMDDNEEIDVFDLRTQIVNSSSFNLNEKRKILPELNNLSEEEKYALLQKIKEHTNKEHVQKSSNFFISFFNIFKNIFMIFHNYFYDKFILKYFFFVTLIISSWFIYTSPGWIQVYAFPKDVWKIRHSLSLIKKQLPEYYTLVINNTDKIVLDDDRPDWSWGHFSNFFNKRYTYVKYINRNSHIRLSGLLVHEACHGNQDKMNRLGSENHQKLENECTYLWIYTMEILGKNSIISDNSALQFLHETASSKTWHWWSDWKKEWNQWDTSQWMMNLLPKEKIRERELFWEHYDYELWKISTKEEKKVIEK